MSLSHVDDPTMDRLVAAVSARLNGHGKTRWTLERWMTLLTFVAALSSICFTAGLNWSKVSRLEADVERNEQYASVTYVRNDVLQLELRNLRETIETLNRELAEHTRALERVEAR